MTVPLITAVLAGVLLIFQQFLMMTVGFRRLSTQVGVGISNDKNLERLVRRHGNLAENAAIFLVVLGLMEMLGASTTAVISFAVIFLIGRIFHALGFVSLAGSHGGEYAENKKLFVGMRGIGAMTTAFLGFAAGGYLLYIGLQLL